MCVNAKIVNVVYCMCISENTIIRSNGWPASSVEVFSTSRNWRENDGASEKNVNILITHCCTCFQYAVLRNGSRN